MLGLRRLLVELEDEDDESMRTFDWVGPFAMLHAMNRRGSRSWAEYFGLAGFETGSKQEQRRAQAQQRAAWLRDSGQTLLQRWFLARGLGTPEE